MTYEQIRLEIDSPTATITLNRPEAMNAITVVMLGEIADALSKIATDPTIRAVIITGEGRAFSAGVDLKALGARSLEGGAVGDYLDVPARAVIDAIASLEAIVIAKINGFCFTGALELALACDLIIAANEAKFGDTHGKWGLRPSWGMSQRLPRLVGPQRARLISYSAMTFTGVQSAEWGLACASHPLEELSAAVDALTATIAGHSKGALLAYKDLYRAADELELAEGLAYEWSTSYSIDDTEQRVAQFR
jgi:enoyl-CoA hydratase/carnithine racemase